jgi:5-methylcytosine-specific restriction endonuclease McrA
MPNRAPIHQPSFVAMTTTQRRSLYSVDGKTTRHPFYVTQRWKRLRVAYLNTHPLCACGCGHPAVEVDHIKPHRGDAALMFDWHNLQGMTKACHSRKTATEVNAR